MKTPVAITMIIMGTLLVMTPAISDYFFQRNLVELMSQPGITSVNLDGKMTDLYRIGCWMIGGMMVTIALICSMMDTKPVSVREKLAAQAV